VRSWTGHFILTKMPAMASYEKRTWWSRHQLTERLADESFLEAAVTTAFLIAAADGHASEQEYDALLDRLEILGGVDRDKIDALLTAASNDVEASGFEPRIARVAELVGDRAAAEAALMLGLAVALAEDDVSAEEREVVTQLATALGLATADLDGMLAEVRG
jgi:tellurite resistance protein